MIERIKQIINLPVIISAIILAFLLSCLLLAFQAAVVPNVQFPENVKAVVEVIPAALELEIDQEIPMNTGNNDLKFDGMITSGSIVKVSGTGQDGLRMRVDPGTDQKVLYLAQENEFFKVIEGPQISDQFIWWKIQALEDTKRIGWSVQDYLIETQP